MNVKFNIGYHAELTEEANNGALDQEQLGYVVAANIAQDLYQTQSQVHFDNCDFPGGVTHIEGLWNAIYETGDKYSSVALTAFGALLHTTQDFYAHSNWIELHEQQAPIPVWDQKVANLPAKIVSGTWLLGFPKLCGPNAPTHSALNKDSPTSTEGAKIVGSGPNQGKSLFDLAYATALAATRLQYARFSAVKLAPLSPAPRSGVGAGEAVLERLILAHQHLRDVW
jgi:hypothetical protein